MDALAECAVVHRFEDGLNGRVLEDDEVFAVPPFGGGSVLRASDLLVSQAVQFFDVFDDDARIIFFGQDVLSKLCFDGGNLAVNHRDLGFLFGTKFGTGPDEFDVILFYETNGFCVEAEVLAIII